MKFTKLVPNVFYTDIKVGFKLFIECLEFSIGYDELSSEDPFCVIEKDELRINRPWGAREFALKDESDVCMIIQQW